VEHRFQPGQSGNPAGRPPGSKNRKNRSPRKVRDPLDEKISYPVNGKPRRITRAQALILSAEARALKEKDGELSRLLLDLHEDLTEVSAKVDYNNWVDIIIQQPIGGKSIEHLLCRIGLAKLVDPQRSCGRMMLNPFLVEKALERLGDKALTRSAQKKVLAATRMANRVTWPAWWEPDLRKRLRDGRKLLVENEKRWNARWHPRKREKERPTAVPEAREPRSEDSPGD
jgi:hypothetical protein